MSSDKELVEESVANTTLMTVGLTSANAAANLITMTSQSLAIAAHNAVANQQQGNITRQASGTQGRTGMYATSQAVTGSVTQHLLD